MEEPSEVELIERDLAITRERLGRDMDDVWQQLRPSAVVADATSSGLRAAASLPQRLTFPQMALIALGVGAIVLTMGGSLWRRGKTARA